MQTSDRFRMFRSLGLAIAALLLVGGAVLGSQVITGGSHGSDANDPPGASADLNGDNEDGDASESPEASESEDASESPEASGEETEDKDVNEDVNEDVNDDSGGDEPESESESPDAK